MSSLFGVLNLARDAILAQQGGIDATGQNIANASTPGYVRREPLLSTRPLGGTEGGVEMSGYARRLDIFAYAQVVEEEGKRGAADARAQALSSIEASFGAADQNIGARLADLFASFSRLTSTPSDVNLRGEVLAKAEALVEGFASMAENLTAARGELASRARAVATEANAKLREVATLNERIAEAQALGSPAGDLRDRRDVLIRELGENIGARAVEDDRGEVTLFAGGIALVSGGSTSTLDVSVSASGALAISATRPGGSVVDVTAQVVEQGLGALGGIARTREADVPALASALDTLAFDFANAVNAVHSAGVGLDGVSGRPFFDVSATAAGAARSLQVSTAIAGRPDLIGASASAAGNPGNGDVALALAALVDAPLASGESPAKTFARFAADLGARLASARDELSLREDTVMQADTLHSSVSGVSLDEEMVKLTQFQRAFEASTRVLRIADELLQGLMRDL